VAMITDKREYYLAMSEIESYLQKMKDILVFIMHQLNINQTELSQALDISKTLLSDVLNGKKKPNLDT
jgi:hypothetical protein